MATTRRIVFTLVLALTLLSVQVSARRLFDDNSQKRQQNPISSIYDITKHRSKPISDIYDITKHRSKSTDYKSLEEIDRLKLSISKLLCESLDEGCEHMEDAADHTVSAGHAIETFANLNPQDHVQEFDDESP